LLKISENTVDAFSQPQNDEWVERHVRELKEIAPEEVVYFSKDDFYSIIERMLVRADALGLRPQETTVAFCYASLKLGIGFDVNSDYAWGEEIENIPVDKQADHIWRNVHAVLGRPTEKTG